MSANEVPLSKMKKNIIIAGVGGQGNIFAGAVMCRYAIEKGYNVAGTETIGAAQRGGSVVSHIRIADGPIHSPLIPAGTADVLVGMECLELLRNFHMLGPNGWYLLNLYRVPTVYTNLGIDRYPTMDEIFESLNLHDVKGVNIPATAKAVELGSPQITNMVLLGALVRADGFFNREEVRALVETSSPVRFRSSNLDGFDAGYDFRPDLSESVS